MSSLFEFDHADILDVAADHIEQYGHAKVIYGHAAEPTCVMGAVRVAIESLDCGTVTRLDHILSRWLDKQCVLYWNDEPQRTKEEVVRELREAACRLRLGELK